MRLTDVEHNERTDKITAIANSQLTDNRGGTDHLSYISLWVITAIWRFCPIVLCMRIHPIFQQEVMEIMKVLIIKLFMTGVKIKRLWCLSQSFGCLKIALSV